ncbi:MAG: Fpg/Nei family DNA glycosylase [Chromatiaceae bacterium]|jgi:endonuclease-8|nr:Fpg/Nei family DNA glycosylase [Chromatiaceae bacterium]
MPEGDTVHKLAIALAAELTGARVRVLRLRRLDGRHLEGCRVLRVWSKGKHLYIELDRALVLRTHLGMYGSWHRYAPGEPWRRPERQAGVLIETDAAVFVCFNPKEVEALAAEGFARIDSERRLGPDLTRGVPDGVALVARARGLLAPDAWLADVLLDQRVASGIGNVYKCEVLFLRGQHPMRRLGETPDEELAELYALAGELLRRNLGGGPRVTRWPADGRGRLWVYGRGGQPCLRCQAEIRRDRLGRNPRSTYWCPQCQR